MRLNDNQVIEGITHWCPFVRQHAVRYFAEARASNTGAMRAVIDGVRKYGWKDFLVASHCVEDLAQDEASVRWYIDELAKAAVEGYRPHPTRIGFRDRLAGVLAGADVNLLRRFQCEVFELERVPLRERERIVLRMRLSDLDAVSCWRELESFCEREKHTRYGSELDVQTAEALVEAIARHGDRLVDRVERVLEDGEHMEDWRDNPLSWLEGFAVQIAGRMRHEAAVPMILHKMHRGGEWLNEQCLKALGWIGTDTVVEQIAGDFASGDWSCRLYTCGALERIHSDLNVRTIINLFRTEEDEDIRLWLATAAMADFSEESVQLVLDHAELRGHSEWPPLRDDVVAVATLMDIPFRELDRWRWESEQESARLDRLYDEPRRGTALREESEDPDLVPVGFPDPHQSLKRILGDDYDPLQAGAMKGTIRQPTVRVGRNDPCPCGSGKKYKQCCLRKDSRG
jgi:hypothetical protein